MAVFILWRKNITRPSDEKLWKISYSSERIAASDEVGKKKFRNQKALHSSHTPSFVRSILGKRRCASRRYSKATRPQICRNNGTLFIVRPRRNAKVFAKSDMKTKIKQRLVTLILCCLCLPCFALDRWAALGMIETGNDDAAVGASGEVSRFQCRPEVWRAATNLPLSAARNPFTAQAVAEVVMQGRVTAFVAHWKRKPTDAEFYELWSRPSTVMGGRKPTPNELERSLRFSNLCQMP